MILRGTRCEVRGTRIDYRLEIKAQSEKPVVVNPHLTPRPSRGKATGRRAMLGNGGRGGVCIFMEQMKLQTPPRPPGTPPLEGRGIVARKHNCVLGLIRNTNNYLYLCGMKREVYEKQKTFAGEKKPSMQRAVRASGNGRKYT